MKKKEVADILKSTGISITIKANLKVVDFLDITLDLETGTYKTYDKPNNTPLYVHKESRHPPNVTKNIPLNVNQRISGNSSNEELFKETTPIFQQTLKNSGYNHQLKFEKTNPREKSKTSRKRNVIYFNPPFAANVKSRVGEKILKLVKDSKLSKIVDTTTNSNLRKPTPGRRVKPVEKKWYLLQPPICSKCEIKSRRRNIKVG